MMNSYIHVGRLGFEYIGRHERPISTKGTWTKSLRWDSFRRHRNPRVPCAHNATSNSRENRRNILDCFTVDDGRHNHESLEPCREYWLPTCISKRKESCADVCKSIIQELSHLGGFEHIQKPTTVVQQALQLTLSFLPVGISILRSLLLHALRCEVARKTCA